MDDRRDALDAAVRMAVTMAVTAFLALILLLRSGGWAALALIPLAVAVLAYNRRRASRARLRRNRAGSLRPSPCRPAHSIADGPGQHGKRQSGMLNEQWCDHVAAGNPPALHARIHRL